MTVRHRLNRGGDRALNRAIHASAMARMRSCPRTRAYVARRTAEEKTPREIRRCLKGYIAPELYRQLTDNRTQLLAIVDDIAPGLTSRYGIGPVTAAQAIVSFSHPGRCRNEAAFAALGGTSPLPASSGRTIRHRLNRGGDRALNRAIHAIALTRMRSCPRTRAYVARRTAEGKTAREIRRCLKRYIARELYRQLTQSMKPLTNP